MKILIITYYWPPAGGSGVQRWLKFVKYLQDFGIEPVIYTPKNAKYPIIDSTLQHEIPKNITVLKQSIWEPTDLLFWKQKNSKKNSTTDFSLGGILAWIRGNFFIPDPKIFWVKKSVKYLQNYISENEIDFIISTGPPHSMHLIAQKLQKKTGIKWVADFRDPWADLYYNKNFKQTNFAKNRNKKLEKLVLRSADCVVTVSDSLKKTFEKTAKKVEVITNGFDDEVLQKSAIELDSKFSISYIGLLPKQSNPKTFFKVLNALCKENPTFKNDLQINLIGTISEEIREEIEKNNLIQNTFFKGYIPHSEAIKQQKKSQVLLLLIPNVKNSKGILTGKLFEYLTSKRPILAIGPENGDLKNILEETNTGTVIGFENEKKLQIEILSLYQHFKNGKLVVESKNIEKYHRRKLTKKLVSIIKKIIN